MPQGTRTIRIREHDYESLIKEAEDNRLDLVDLQSAMQSAWEKLSDRQRQKAIGTLPPKPRKGRGAANYGRSAA